MKIETFAELTTPDEFVLRLTPLGFSTMGSLSADDAAKFQQETIAGSDLHDDVPEGTRKNFERLRALHSYGILCYDAYTVAEDLAWLVLEGALRERFISVYSGEIPLVKADGTEHPIVARHFDEVDEAFRPGGSHAKGKWHLKLTTGGAMPFRGRMGQLLEWARKDGLLPGQGNKRLDDVYVRLRNNVAHPHYHIAMPPDSARAIRDLAEIINRLWGHPTPGGRLYPAPLTREPMVIAWRGDPPGRELTLVRAERLEYFREVGDWRCIVVRAVAEDDGLCDFDAHHERTLFPAELLWGPGTRQDALRWLSVERPKTDTVEYLDRLFTLRIHDHRVSLPITPETMLGLPEALRVGDWLVLRADFPNHALMHARHLKDGIPCGTEEPITRREANGLVMTIPPIPACPVEEVARGSWEEVAKALEVSYQLRARRAIPRVLVPPRFGLAPDIEVLADSWGVALL
jgi:hypothetical protein